MVDDLEYLGETKPRRPGVAMALTYVAPGLGYMYIGHLLKGITINLLFLLMLETFVIVFSVLKFFPLLPAIVFVIAWFVFTTFAARDVRNRIVNDATPYVLKGYNHWMVYSVIVLCTFAAPILATVHFMNTFLIGFERIQDSGTYPTLRRGDTVLIDRSAFRGRSPVRGELVVVEADHGLALRRIVGVAQDAIRIEGDTVFVNEQPLERFELEPAPPTWLEKGELLAMGESNNGSRYVISVSPRAYSALILPPTELKPDHFFVLADNRSQVPVETSNARLRDSRNYGAVKLSAIKGKPLYIAWSSDPENGDLRSDRIGLQVR